MKTATAADPRKSEAYQRSRELWTRKFKSLSAAMALCRQFSEPASDLAVEFVERGLSTDDMRRELAQRAAQRSWATPLAEARGPMMH